MTFFLGVAVHLDIAGPAVSCERGTSWGVSFLLSLFGKFSLSPVFQKVAVALRSEPLAEKRRKIPSRMPLISPLVSNPPHEGNLNTQWNYLNFLYIITFLYIVKHRLSFWISSFSGSQFFDESWPDLTEKCFYRKRKFDLILIWHSSLRPTQWKFFVVVFLRKYFSLIKIYLCELCDMYYFLVFTAFLVSSLVFIKWKKILPSFRPVWFSILPFRAFTWHYLRLSGDRIKIVVFPFSILEFLWSDFQTLKSDILIKNSNELLSPVATTSLNLRSFKP